MQSGRQGEFGRVRAVLAGRPSLHEDRMTINLVELAKAARVAKFRFRYKPFTDILAARQAKIVTGFEASGVDPFVHGHVFALTERLPSSPTPFRERIGSGFTQGTPGLVQQKKKRRRLLLLGALCGIGASYLDPIARHLCVHQIPAPPAAFLHTWLAG